MKHGSNTDEVAMNAGGPECDSDHDQCDAVTRGIDGAVTSGIEKDRRIRNLMPFPSLDAQSSVWTIPSNALSKLKSGVRRG